jgi:trans-aconitate methyltransferase
VCATWNAELYNSKHSFVWELGAGVVDLLAPHQGERILDIGCGTGHLTARIAQVTPDVIGIDSSAEMIQEAKKAYPQIQFIVADARDFHFDRPFDAVFSNAALHWIREPEKVVRCVWNALRPGGRFVAEMGGAGNVQSFIDAFDTAVKHIGAGGKLTANPWFFPTLAQYVAILDGQGFTITFATLFDRPTPLDGGQNGLREWIRMFAANVYSQLSAEQQERFASNVEEQLRPTLFRDDHWIGEYKRLRISAFKPCVG